MIIESANFLLFIYIHAPYILNKYCYTFLMIPFDTLIVNSFFLNPVQRTNYPP